MKVDLPLSSPTGALADVAAMARNAESSGFDGVSYSEVVSDPLLHLTIAAGTTDRVDLPTMSNPTRRFCWRASARK